MRDEKRISVVLDIFENNDKILALFLGTKSGKLIYDIYDYWDEIEEMWNNYPDLRFGQLLCNLALIPSQEIEDRIWNIEEYDWLIKNNYINDREAV